MEIAPGGCRVCRARPLAFVKVLHGEYRHRDVPLYRCAACKCLFTLPQRYEDETDLGHVNSIEWHLMGLPYNQRKARALFQLIERRRWVRGPEKQFLDIGCALGHALAEAEKWGFEARGIEPEAVAAAYAKDVTKVNVHHGYFAFGALGGMTFDVIMLDNVLEHVPEPAVLFGEIARTLKSGGVFFLGVPPVEWIRKLTSISYIMPERRPTKDWRTRVSESRRFRFLSPMDTFGYPDGHVNYFSGRGVAMLARDHGLRVEQQFHAQTWRSKVYPWFGLTTGFWILRKVD